MSYLVDTNILISFINKEQEIVERVRAVGKVYISIVSIGELFFGAIKSQFKEKNLFPVNIIIKCNEICNINLVTANHYGEIKNRLQKAGNPIPQNDLWIVASAIEHDLVLVSRDRHILSISDIRTEKW